MNKIIYFLLVGAFLLSCKPDGKHKKIILKSGDLIFQNLDCGPLCQAIEEVTHGRYGLKFSHIGLVVNRHDSLYIVEATGKQVQLTSINDYLQRTTNKMYVGRLKKQYEHLIADAVHFSINQLGVPYDKSYIYDNGKYYCSELIYDAFKFANGNNAFFSLEPMTFKQPGSTDFYTAWVDYYSKLNVAIPEGLPGINPAGISRSEKIDFSELTLARQ